MAMTKKTITVWNTMPQTNTEFNAARTEKIEALKTEGKTDEVLPTTISENSFQRNWLNAAAANEWVTFLNEKSTQYGVTQTTTVSDI
jgi:hypothetical protein